MKSDERREKIIERLRECSGALPGKSLAEELGVSRQVIVQDITVLRAKGFDIAATTNGYVLSEERGVKRVFKVIHTDEQVSEEMNLIVDYGGVIEDVFIYHKVYGLVRGDMDIRSRKDVEDFVANLASGKSSLLKNVTSGYHYHTVTAPTAVILDLIQEKLSEHGFLAPLTDYEPVEFGAL